MVVIYDRSGPGLFGHDFEFAVKEERVSELIELLKSMRWEWREASLKSRSDTPESPGWQSLVFEYYTEEPGEETSERLCALFYEELGDDVVVECWSKYD